MELPPPVLGIISLRDSLIEVAATCEGVTVLEFLKPKNFKMETSTTRAGNYVVEGLSHGNGSNMRGSHHLEFSKPKTSKWILPRTLSLKRQQPARESLFWSFRGPEASK